MSIVEISRSHASPPPPAALQGETARQRLERLTPEFLAEHRWRRVVGTRGVPVPNGVLDLDRMEAWFRHRGLRCRLRLDGTQISLDGEPELVPGYEGP